MTPERRTSTLNNAFSVYHKFLSLDRLSTVLRWQLPLSFYGEKVSDQGDMLEDSHQGLVDNVHSSGLSTGRSRRQTNRDLPGNLSLLLQTITKLLNQA